MAELDVDQFRERLDKIHTHFVKHRYVFAHSTRSPTFVNHEAARVESGCIMQA